VDVEHALLLGMFLIIDLLINYSGFKVKKVMLCNILEEEKQETKVQDKCFDISFTPYQILTIKATFD
jgi:alpha-mannosidase